MRIAIVEKSTPPEDVVEITQADIEAFERVAKVLVAASKAAHSDDAQVVLDDPEADGSLTGRHLINIKWGFTASHNRAPNQFWNSNATVEEYVRYLNYYLTRGLKYGEMSSRVYDLVLDKTIIT